MSKIENVPIAVIQNAIKRHIWLNAYAELLRPIAELQHYALLNARTRDESKEIGQLCNQINALLECPVSKAAGTLPAI